MRFELYVAARYLRAKRRQAVVGVVTTISIAGVAAGVAALVIALAITTGSRSSNAFAISPTSPPPRRESTGRCWSRAARAPASR